MVNCKKCNTKFTSLSYSYVVKFFFIFWSCTGILLNNSILKYYFFEAVLQIVTKHGLHFPFFCTKSPFFCTKSPFFCTFFRFFCTNIEISFFFYFSVFKKINGNEMFIKIPNIFFI